MNTNTPSLGPEAGKLLMALQEFISATVRQTQLGNSDGIEVDLKAPASVPTVSHLPKGIAHALKQAKYQNFMQRLQVTLRERVFSIMPIRVLYFTPRGPTDSKLHITLLDRNGVCSQIVEWILAEYPEQKFEEEVRSFSASSNGNGNCASAENCIIEKWISQYTRYAILSHTWLRGSDAEVTYGAWHTGQFDAKQPGFQKLAKFCQTASNDYHLVFGWMDTVCINKESSSELDESIRSMYKWYRGSTICITYLADTVSLPKIHQDRWFTRGWTFQELLAPRAIKFYDQSWKQFVPSPDDDKCGYYILDQIKQATTITEAELCNPQNMPISRKMQLAAKREVTREEDRAYSLMGICDVSISTAYGEGGKSAFLRLITQILSSSNRVLDIFNCAHDGYSIIPSTPSAYIHRSTSVKSLSWQKPIEPLILTHVGLRIPILLMPSLQDDDPAFKNIPIGSYSATIEIPKPWSTSYSGPFRLLDKGLELISPATQSRWTTCPWSRKSGLKAVSYPERTTFGVLNFGGDNTKIKISGTCLAVGFRSRWDVEWESPSTSIKRHPVREPVVFELMERSTQGRVKSYSIERSELAKHGMKLVIMYL